MQTELTIKKPRPLHLKGTWLKAVSSLTSIEPLKKLMAHSLFKDFSLNAFRQFKTSETDSYLELMLRTKPRNLLSLLPSVSSLAEPKFKEEAEDFIQKLKNYNKKNPLFINFFEPAAAPRVYIGIKDEINVKGLPTTLGMEGYFDVEFEDAHIVSMLKKKGFYIAGKLNMHEAGTGVSGINPHYGTPKNPKAPDRMPGGSSSASAAVVSEGLMSASIGADGGGSIRIPAGFCGVFGLKPTYTRVSERGAKPICPSVGHLGPIASSPEILWDIFCAIAQKDELDFNNSHAPLFQKEPLRKVDFSKLRIAVDWAWFNDCDVDQKVNAKRYLDRMVKKGAKIVEITLKNLEIYRCAHLVLITTEMINYHRTLLALKPSQFGADVRLNLKLCETLSSRDYFQAKCLQTQMFKEWVNLFKDFDVMISPTTGCVAPKIPAGAKKNGNSNLSQVEKIMRFVWPTNLNGFPSIAIPSGVSAENIPTSVQLMAAPFEELLLLSVAASCELF